MLIADAVIVDPITAGASVCHLFPTMEIFAILIVPDFSVPPPGFSEIRNSLIAVQFEAVAELMLSGTRTTFHPV